jgi:predicted Zn-dependent protease
MILDEAQVRQIIERAISFSSADEVRVNLRGGREGNTRFALNTVTTCGDVESLHVAVTACFGRRRAAATASQVDDDSLRRVVRAAEELARVAPEDPEHVGELGPQEYLTSNAWADGTAEATPALRARAALGAVEAAEARQMETSGYFEHGQGFSAAGNNRGLFAWSRHTDASFSVTMRADAGGSGWASSNSRDIDEVDYEQATRLAVEKARAARDPRPLEPGVYPVILEPQAACDFLSWALWCMSARQADEGRSFFARPGGGNRIAQQVAAETVTIRSDPAHPAVPGDTFQADGLPLRPQTWIERGVLKRLVYDRFWAQKQHTEPTGWPANVIVEGGEGTVDDLVRAASRAVLVTRFWYIRFVDPQTLLLTGLTRDGTFWVEDGQIRHAVRNFRFNESPMAVLNKVTALSAPVRVGYAFMPAVAAGEFTFSSASESV